MITIELSSKKETDANKIITLELPASGYDIQDALEKLGIQDSSDCKLADVITPIDELDFYFNSAFLIAEDIPKLNILATILNGLNDDELDIFSALLFKDEPYSLEEIVCIAANTDEACLEDIYTKRELGHFLVDKGYIEIPEDTLSFISYRKIAKFYLNYSNCALTPYGFVDDASGRCEHCEYCCGEEIFDELFETISESHDTVVFQIALAPRKNIKEKQAAAVTLSLPATDESLDEVLFILGVKSFEDVHMVCVQSRNQFFVSKFAPDTDVKLLNELAKTIMSMDVTAFCKYKAVLEYNRVTGKKGHKTIPNTVLASLITEAGQIHYYDFLPWTGNDSQKAPVGGGWEQTSYGLINCRDRHTCFAIDNLLQ